MVMRRRSLLFLLLTCGACAPEPPAVDPSLALLGGDTTVFDDSSEAFNYPLRNASPALRAAFQIGDGIFSRNWITAPATPQGNDGLGPTFNATSCSGCHDGDGRGPPPEGDEPLLALFLRLSVPGQDAHGGPLPEPSYGEQLQNHAILGVPAEGDATVTYVEQPGAFADGEPYSLRRPTYTLKSLGYGPMASGFLFSPRIARQVIGLGLLQAVSEETIVGFTTRGGGGHPNYVWDLRNGHKALGRFGWKATQPTVEQQTLLALSQDIGITSDLFPAENCPAVQTACAQAPMSQTQPNLEPLKADALIKHGMAVAVPARRHLDDPVVMAGEQVFLSAPCPICHVPTMTTGVLPDYPELSNQTIHPYTDLLLHDMGEGLADHRPDYQASGREWRTPPLWGIGLIESINDHTYFLNDGRARNLAEAILWHDGQAAAAREAFRNMSRQDRTALLAFLNSL
jgi:CxxC motif-containing protein (DUF1111 family)